MDKLIVWTVKEIYDFVPIELHNDKKDWVNRTRLLWRLNDCLASDNPDYAFMDLIQELESVNK